MAPEQATPSPLEVRLNRLSLYHYYVFFWIFIFKIPMTWHILNLIFLSPPMDYECISPKNNGTKNSCPCGRLEWDRSVFTETMQTKFYIYCDNYWWISFSHSTAYAGMLFGSLIFGYMSDRFGRVPVISLSGLTLSISGCLLSVMPTIPSFTFMRFVEGMSTGGCIVISYVIVIEYCGSKFREIVTALYHIPINLGHVTLAGVSYFFRDFDDFQLAISLPMIFFGLLKFLIMESPRWLMSNDNIDKVVEVMERFTHSNSEADLKGEVEAYTASKGQTIKMNLKIWEIFKYRQLTINFFCMAFIYFVCGIGYYGVSQFIGEMSSNIHINVAISGAMLIPGTVACVFLLGRIGRRPFMFVTSFLSGIFMLTVVCIPQDYDYVRIGFACICNCFFFMTFIIAFLYGVELFPTSVRNSVLGFLSVLTRLGQVVAPLINSLSQNTAGMIFGVFALSGSVLCVFLPETRNTELPTTIEETTTISQNIVKVRI